MKSPYDGSSRRPLRLIIAAVAAVDVIALSVALTLTRPSDLSHPFAPAFLLALGGHPLRIAPIAAVGLASLLFFALKPARIAAGLVGLAALAVLCESHAAILVGPMRVFFASGAVLLGWLAGAAFGLSIGARSSEPQGGARAEALAEVGAAAALAATYVGAGVSKLLASGLSWTDANNLRSIVLTQRGLSGHSPFDFYADALLNHPGLAWALSTATLCIQLGAVFYPWSPRLRALCGSLLFAFHLNVWLLTPISFPQAMALLVALSLPWPRIVARARSIVRARVAGSGEQMTEPPSEAPAALSEIAESSPPDVVRRATFRAGALVVIGVAAAAFPPIRAYTSLHHRREPRGRDESQIPADPSVHALLAGVTEGANFAGFHVDAIRGPLRGAIEVRLSRGELSFSIAITKKGARGVPPPKGSGRYDIFYDRVQPAESALPPADRDRALAAMASTLAATEETAPAPPGL